MVERGVVSIAQLFDAEAASIARLMHRYKNVPMSLADACLVRLIELTSHATLLPWIQILRFIDKRADV